MRQGICRPFSLDGTENVSAESRKTGLGRAVSPFLLISLYLAGPIYIIIDINSRQSQKWKTYLPPTSIIFGQLHQRFIQLARRLAHGFWLELRGIDGEITAERHSVDSIPQVKSTLDQKN